MAKKSTSGKKAFLKSIKAENSDNLSVSSYEANLNEIKDDTATNFQLNRVIC